MARVVLESLPSEVVEHKLKKKGAHEDKASESELALFSSSRKRVCQARYLSSGSSG